MIVEAINHVNILTEDLDGTALFYERLLGLRRSESPGSAMGYKGAWMSDAAGNAIVHLGLKDGSRPFAAENVPGAATGAFHHVAFTCRGYDAAMERLQEMGIDYRADGAVRFGVRQVTLRDPNNINIELNFAGE